METTETTFETKPLASMSTPEMVAYLRQIAIARPDFEVAEMVLLSGHDVLAIARRLAG